MNIATGIIGIILGLLVLMQSCAVATGSSLANDQSTFDAGAIGILAGICYFIGGAFAFGLPRVAMVVFGIAAAIAFLAASQGSFQDLSFWGGVALVLAIMAFFAGRKAKPTKGEAS